MGLLSRFRSPREDRFAAPLPAAPHARAETGNEAGNGAIQGAISRALRPSMAGMSETAETAERLSGALHMLEAAILAIDHLTELLAEGTELCENAREAVNTAKRAAIAERYSALLERIDAYVMNIAEGEANLIDGSRKTCEITLDAAGQSRVVLHVANLTSGPSGLDLSAPSEAFASLSAIDRSLAELTIAKNIALHTADLFADSAAVLSERLGRLKTL